MTGKVVVVSGKRKTAVAKGVGVGGCGRILINGLPLELYKPDVARLKILEPIEVAGSDLISKLDITINTKGGGFIGQAEAARIVLSAILVEFGGESIKDKLMAYDRRMLVEDPRRTEPKKFGGYSARRRKQKSYR
ncbi:MAG: 30S ribosomal protein S9 [Candidatus Methanomethylicaceae archaeon]